jgi:7-carboxy-7-deazaguanine synthase
MANHNTQRDELPGNQRLRVTEIFYSLQGESRPAGCPTGFVRLTGCPLRCQYCDTAYAFEGGEWWGIDAIVDEISGYQTRKVCVTGGEPLAQPNCHKLLEALCDADFDVSLETSGAIDISSVEPRVTVVMDIKTPGSGEVGRNLWSNLESLKSQDQLKFVICDRADYDWSRRQLLERELSDKCAVLFSPSYGQMNPTELAEWILADRLQVRLQLQLHKYLWGEAPGH